MGIILATLCSVARRDKNDVSSCPLLQRVCTRACVCVNVHVCSCVLGTSINAHMCVNACWCDSSGGGKYYRLSQRVSNQQGSACLCLLALWLQTCHNTQAFQGEFWPPSSDPDIGPRTPLGIHFEEMACSWDHNELFSFLRSGPSVVSLSGSQLFSGFPCLSLGELKRYAYLPSTLKISSVPSSPLLFRPLQQGDAVEPGLQRQSLCFLGLPGISPHHHPVLWEVIFCWRTPQCLLLCLRLTFVPD